MEEDRVFKWIDRVNAIGLSLVLLGALVFVGRALIHDLVLRPKPVVTTNVASDPHGQEKWSLGRPQHLEGTGMVYLPLVSERRSIEAPRSASMANYDKRSGLPGPARNLLFVHPETGTMTWLFENNNQMVTQVDPVVRRAPPGEQVALEALLIHVVRRDTNGDGLLDEEDLVDLVFSAPDGRNHVVALSAVERVFYTQLTREGTVMVLFQREGRASAATIRLGDFAVLTQREVPHVEGARE